MDNTEIKCKLCNDTKYIILPDGSAKKCKCQIQAEIRAYLPKMFSNHQINKSFDLTKFINKDFLFKSNLQTFAVFVNTYLTHLFLKSNKPNYKISTVSDLTENFFDGDTNDLYSTDVLFLMLYGGYKNKLTPSSVHAILKDRILHQRQTIFFIDTSDYTDTKSEDYLGQDVIKLLNSNQYNKLKIGK
nr:MAG TPA: hypothetical protein [Bacteriophage sp.]